ncbi:MAG: D-tyrosyl-tRNA(Tyr) deacylase [Acidobacteriaceae bacterium]|nr:D-tyrosyl-tRNA(Tyr) deacylase [Acidobacteriaceae bacterium]
MRALIQRVSAAKVVTGDGVTGEIGPGLLIFLGIRFNDDPPLAEKLAQKVTQLRVFPDSAGKMNRDVKESGGSLLIVSQFTLYGDTRRGNRPSFSESAPADVAEPLYEAFVQYCRTTGLRVETGVFQAHMEVQLTNDGPVTILCSAEN